MTFGLQTMCLCALALILSMSATASSGGHPEDSEDAEQSLGATAKADTIILLQGMGRGRASLWVLDTRLQNAGYSILNFPYVAHSHTIDDLARQLRAFIRENVKTERYHLVGHSLGNLIVRAAFRFEYPSGLGRIVMLAPPNQPADLVRALRDNPIYQWFTGESGQQLASEEFYARLPVPDVEFGIIAGDRSQSFMLKEPNDGVIEVASTKLSGMTDWVVVPQSHNFIMNSRVVAQLCVSFIEGGSFDKDLLTMPEGPPSSGDYEAEPEPDAGND